VSANAISTTISLHSYLHSLLSPHSHSAITLNFTPVFILFLAEYESAIDAGEVKSF